MEKFEIGENAGERYLYPMKNPLSFCLHKSIHTGSLYIWMSSSVTMKICVLSRHYLVCTYPNNSTICFDAGILLENSQKNVNEKKWFLLACWFNSKKLYRNFQNLNSRIVDKNFAEYCNSLNKAAEEVNRRKNLSKFHHLRWSVIEWVPHVTLIQSMPFSFQFSICSQNWIKIFADFQPVL